MVQTVQGKFCWLRLALGVGWADRQENHMKKIIIATLAVAVASTGFAGAVSARGKRPVVAAFAVRIAPVFKAADSNRSRTLSNSEFTAAGGNANNFGMIDANNNGELGFFEIFRALMARFLGGRG